MVRVLIRGIGDVGSAIACYLYMEGFEAILHDGPQPHYARRGMAFTDAMFDPDGAMLEALRARRCDSVATLVAALAQREIIPVTTRDIASLCHSLRPQVLVDARMRKRLIPERQSHLALLTIGVGPNFVAGDTVHLVIESSWDGLGNIITQGPAKPLAGTVREIAGYGIERVIYAPIDGVFLTSLTIGARVQAGTLVGHLEHVEIRAPLGGRLRGLTRSGVAVERGMKIVEIDPRENDALVFGLGERPIKIAEGVLAAIQCYL
jgi:xanthine dehydrogenase accessory factor